MPENLLFHGVSFHVPFKNPASKNLAELKPSLFG